MSEVASLNIHPSPREINVLVILCDFSELIWHQMSGKYFIFKNHMPDTQTNFLLNLSNSESNNLKS